MSVGLFNQNQSFLNNQTPVPPSGLGLNYGYPGPANTGSFSGFYGNLLGNNQIPPHQWDALPNAANWQMPQNAPVATSVQNGAPATALQLAGQGGPNALGQGLSSALFSGQFGMNYPTVGGVLATGGRIANSLSDTFSNPRDPRSIGGSVGSVGGAVAGALTGSPTAMALGSQAGHHIGRDVGNVFDFDEKLSDQDRILYSAFGGPVGWSIVAGDAIGNQFGSGKDAQQRQRDATRAALQQQGFIDDDFVYKFPTGEKFDFGAETIGDRGHGEYKAQKSFDVDFDNPVAGDVVALVNPLSIILSGGAGGVQQEQFAGMLTNSVLMAAGDDNAMHPGYAAQLYRSFGLTPQDVKDAFGLMLEEGTISQEMYDVSMQKVDIMANWDERAAKETSQMAASENEVPPEPTPEEQVIRAKNRRIL